MPCISSDKEDVEKEDRVYRPVVALTESSWPLRQRGLTASKDAEDSTLTLSKSVFSSGDRNGWRNHCSRRIKLNSSSHDPEYCVRYWLNGEGRSRHVNEDPTGDVFKGEVWRISTSKIQAAAHRAENTTAFRSLAEGKSSFSSTTLLCYTAMYFRVGGSFGLAKRTFRSQ